MRNATMLNAVLAALFAAGGGVLGLTDHAQASECCEGDCSPDPAGVIEEVYVDEVPTGTCDGDFGEDLDADVVMGQQVMMLESGRLYIPALNVTVDTLDVEPTNTVEIEVDCRKLAAMGGGEVATGMGHGGCK